MGDTREGLTAYLDNMVRRYRELEGSLPTAPWDEDIAPWFWQGPKESGWAPWRPLEKKDYQDVRTLTLELASAHHSVDEYYNSFWFALIQDYLGEHSLNLPGVQPGMHPEGLIRAAKGYRAAMPGREGRVPLGSNIDGFVVVVDNSTGAVGLEDYETGEVSPLASSIGELLRGMCS